MARSFILLAFGFFLFSAAIQVSAITKDDATNKADFTAGGVRSAPLTFQHTIASNNEVLYVGVSNNTTTLDVNLACAPFLTSVGTVSNISFGSQTNFERLTVRGTGANAIASADGCTSVEIFRLINPTPGTATISVTIPTGGDYVVIGAISFTGVDTSTPAAMALEPATGTTQNPAVTIAGTNTYNGIVLDTIAAKYAAQDITLGNMSLQTRQWRLLSDPSTPPQFYVGAGSTQPTNAGTAVTMNWQLASTGSWALGATAIKEVASASPASISGRVLTQSGRGVYGAFVFLTDNFGEKRKVLTNPFGYFQFSDVPSGETYTVSVAAKNHTFSSQIVNVAADVTELTFVAQP